MLRVTAAIMLSEGKVLIAQRAYPDKLANKWEFPGGKIKEGETPEECLKRELHEELGIIIEIGNFFASSIFTDEEKTVHLLAYWTTWKNGKLEAKVHANIKWEALENLFSYDFAPADVPLVEKLIKKDVYNKW